MFLGLFGAGVVAAFVAGLLGVGGGIVMVPALYHVFLSLGLEAGSSLRQAIATSLTTIIITSFVSVRAHARQGAVDAGLLRAWAVPVVVGAALGGLLAGSLEAVPLAVLFAVLAFLVATSLAVGKPRGPQTPRTPQGIGLWTLGGGIGFFSAVMGVGGGAFGVSVLTLCGRAIHQAVGTAAGLGMMVGLPGAVSLIWAGHDAAGRAPFSVGYVNVAGFLILVCVSFLVTPWGARCAHRLSQLMLRRVFAAFLVVVAVDILRRTL